MLRIAAVSQNIQVCSVGTRRVNNLQERWIEARHARNKRAISGAHNVGPAYIGFLSVLDRLRSIVARGHTGDDDDLARLAQKCARVNTNLNIMDAMGLALHPQVRRVVEEYSGPYQTMREVNRYGAKDLVKILFHCDRETLHTRVPDLKSATEYFPPECDDGGGGDGGDDGDDPPGPGPGLGVPLPPVPLPPPPNTPSKSESESDVERAAAHGDNGDGGDGDGGSIVTPKLKRMAPRLGDLEAMSWQLGCQYSNPRRDVTTTSLASYDVFLNEHLVDGSHY